MTVNVKKKKKKRYQPRLAFVSTGMVSFERYLQCMCVVSLYYDSHGFRLRAHPLRDTHKNPYRETCTCTKQTFNSFFIISIHRTSSTAHDNEKKGGKNKPSMEEYVPFEVVFLLGIGFGVTWLLKQIIKCNGWRGLQSFISNGKNKVLDDLGDSGAGFDGNSHACWNSLLWNILICANRQVLS